MTIDDFDVNEISDKLAVREETENALTLEACHDDGLGVHDDGHDDGGPPCHDDLINGPFHDDHTCGHNDGHFDLQSHDDHGDCFNDIPPKG